MAHPFLSVRACQSITPQFGQGVVTPAQVEDTLQGAGVQAQVLDSRFRGNDFIKEYG